MRKLLYICSNTLSTCSSHPHIHTCNMQMCCYNVTTKGHQRCSLCMLTLECVAWLQGTAKLYHAYVELSRHLIGQQVHILVEILTPLGQ